MINLNKKSVPVQIKSVLIPGLAFCILATACKIKRVIYTPRGYDITKPYKIELGNKLREISGIAWVDENTMLAENDEAGKVFTINLKDKRDLVYPHFVFGEKNDYEDIVKVNTTLYLLISTGQIVEIPAYSRDGDAPGTIIATMAGKNNEFESMYYDKDVNSLILLCKSCHKEKDQVRTAYRFDLATRQFADTPYYAIDINIIRQKLDDNRAEFRPSAAAIHPLQNKLYIVSSIGKLLVITDKKGKVEQAMPISATLFPQPEGITFAANGDMFISNEAGIEDQATLLKFRYKP
jgi:SdiA-regulated